MTRPQLLIETWMPIEAIGAESKRERGASSALPPLYFLHVWWARRPLIASRAAVLAGVLPAWSPDFPEPLQRRFPNQETYHQWFTYLCGIRGDPVKGQKLIAWAKNKGVQLPFHPYGGAPRAFTVNPEAEDLKTLRELLAYTWGTEDLSVLDPFAGGGSIPFESLRYGFKTIANDLNPVAAVILKATLDYPARFGPSLAEDIRKWGNIWAEKVEKQLMPYFPKQKGENIFAYLWARTVACPVTGKPVPLSPNWWLSKDPPVAVRLLAEPGMDTPRFEIVHGAAARAADPDNGTVSRGNGRSPWTDETIDGGYIKAEAQAGRMGQMLYAVALKMRGGFEFRAPTQEDLEAVARAEQALQEKKPEWIAKDIIPTEAVIPGEKTGELIRYGMNTWANIFSERQLYATLIFKQILNEVLEEINTSEIPEKVLAIHLFLSFALEKCLNYNSLLCSWHVSRGVIRSVFERHDFGFAWSFGEFDASGNLLPWSIDQIVDSYKNLASLSHRMISGLFDSKHQRDNRDIDIYLGSANNLYSIESNSLENITLDPPYYDNVQYAELSDFFYVWLKRSVGHLFPEFFTDELTNKDDEAVANPARFEGMGRKKKELAEQDYERKMAAAFREMHRVLHPDGCMTVMFTHKKVEAWDTLASALIGAGFVINASWPVHTESEHSLHQARKNAAASTILLACRKRPSPRPSTFEGEGEEVVWWDDLQGKVRQTARRKAEEFSALGISGVDLYISTFGPTLSIISEHWPVLTSEVDPKTGQPKPLRPETALDLAREEVVRLRKEGLLLGRQVQFDPVTDWYLMAWDAFAAEQFPYDEARKLAIALGVELDGEIMAQKRLAVKKSSFIILQQPAQRRKRGMVDDEVLHFEHWVDAAHTAMLIYAEDGAGPCQVFLDRTRLRHDPTFKALLGALLQVIPRARMKGKFLRPEAEVLENMRLTFYDDIEAPLEEEPDLPQAEQMDLLDWSEEIEEEEEEE